MMCVDRNVQQCNPIIAGMSVDYQEQVVITGIKSGMQCSICHVLISQASITTSIVDLPFSRCFRLGS